MRKIFRKDKKAKIFVSQGDELVQTGNYNAAIVMYDAGLKEAPRDATILTRRSFAYTLLSPPRLDLAFQDADAAVRHGPTNWRAWSQKGDVLLKQGNPRAAVEAFVEAVRLARGEDRHTAQRSLIHAQALLNQTLSTPVVDLPAPAPAPAPVLPSTHLSNQPLPTNPVHTAPNTFPSASSNTPLEQIPSQVDRSPVPALRSSPDLNPPLSSGQAPQSEFSSTTRNHPSTVSGQAPTSSINQPPGNTGTPSNKPRPAGASTFPDAIPRVPPVPQQNAPATTTTPATTTSDPEPVSPPPGTSIPSNPPVNPRIGQGSSQSTIAPPPRSPPVTRAHDTTSVSQAPVSSVPLTAEDLIDLAPEAPPRYEPAINHTDPTVRSLSQQAVSAQLTQLETTLAIKNKGSVSIRPYTAAGYIDAVQLVYVGMTLLQLTSRELGTATYLHTSFRAWYMLSSASPLG